MVTSETEHSQSALFFKKMEFSRLIRENHQHTIIHCQFYQFPEVPGATAPTNLIATVGGNQVNIYDNEHCGDFLDILSNFNHSAPIGCFCWVQAREDAQFAAASGNDIQLVSLAYSKVISVISGHSGIA